MRIAVPMTVLATALACSLASAPAHARARVFVASYGNDANPCTFGSPCKTFQHAHDVADAGGEIDALDSAGYGPVVITKAISIIGNDQTGILQTSNSSAGIFVNAGPSDLINLRGLVIEGAGTGNTGIQYSTAASLSIENCIIRGFTFAGIYQITSSDSTLLVSDTLISDNPSATGILIDPSFSNATASAVLNRVTVKGNGNGVTDVANGGGAASIYSRITVSDSLLTNNSGVGISISVNGFTSLARGMVRNSTIVDNAGGGILASGEPTLVYLSQVTTTENAAFGDLSAASGATITSFGNNSIPFSTPTNVIALK